MEPTLPSRTNRDSRVTVQEEVTPVLQSGSPMRDAGSYCIVFCFIGVHYAGGQFISFSQLRSTFVSALLLVSTRRKCSPTHRVGTLESIAYGQSSHVTHTGGTFGTRQLLWLVTKYSVFPAQAFTFCTAYYSVLSYFNFYVRVVTRACYTLLLLQTK